MSRLLRNVGAPRSSLAWILLDQHLEKASLNGASDYTKKVCSRSLQCDAIRLQCVNCEFSVPFMGFIGVLRWFKVGMGEARGEEFISPHTPPNTMKTPNNDQLIADIKAAEPVGQSSHTGMWGFERVHDCLDLNRCIYPTERSAKIARHKAAVRHVSMLESQTELVSRSGYEATSQHLRCV